MAATALRTCNEVHQSDRSGKAAEPPRAGARVGVCDLSRSGEARAGNIVDLDGFRGGRSQRREENRARAKAEFVAVVGRGLSVTAAAAVAGIARATAYTWRRDDAAFRRAWDAAETDGLDVLEDKVLQAADTDWRAAVELLRVRRPERWGSCPHCRKRRARELPA